MTWHPLRRMQATLAQLEGTALPAFEVQYFVPCISLVILYFTHIFVYMR